MSHTEPPAPDAPPAGLPLLPPASGGPTFARRTLLAAGVTTITAVALGAGLYWFTRNRSPQPTTPLPPTLARLGFTLQTRHGVPVMLPPTVSIPAGPFLMGSDPTKDPIAYAVEQPQSPITIAQAYHIGQFPLTVAEYALAVQAGVVVQPPGDGMTWQDQVGQPDHPVVNVSWLELVKYAGWLSQLTGQWWRLPTEAEWEKAARGTDGRIYPWGNQWDKTRANTSDGGPGRATAVGLFASRGDASLYGAHDMAGNVWQLCSTIYAPYPYQESDGRENMRDTTSVRVTRGGSWINDPQVARAAYRYRFTPHLIDLYIGARLVLAQSATS